MGRNEKKYGTIGLMILTVIIIFSVVGIVIAGFRMIKKNEDARLISAADTEYNKDKEKRQEIEDHLESDGTQEANTETETKGESEEAASDSETDNKEKVFSADENARHVRIFNDQELQEYFQRQNWYVPQTASNDFDDSCLNEVEKYNIQLISTYEQQAGGN